MFDERHIAVVIPPGEAIFLSITDSETSKLPRVSIRISTAFDCCLNQSIFEKFFIKELSVST
jgi:hypothetical protein